MVDHALRNWQRFGDLAKKQHELRNKKDYEETMREDATWGDHSEVIVAADLYQVPIRVFGARSGLVLTENPHGSQLVRKSDKFWGIQFHTHEDVFHT